MLRDEALDWLMDRLEAAPKATIIVSVEHGRYLASIEAGSSYVQGEELPNLTDALASLIEVLP